jgi:hypothetical protein
MKKFTGRLIAERPCLCTLACFAHVHIFQINIICELSAYVGLCYKLPSERQSCFKFRYKIYFAICFRGFGVQRSGNHDSFQLYAARFHAHAQ